jgi:hypothetical protein
MLSKLGGADPKVNKSTPSVSPEIILTEFEQNLLKKGASLIRDAHAKGTRQEESLAKERAREANAVAEARTQKDNILTALKKDNRPAIYGGMKNAPYWACMITLAFGEFAFNSVAFEAFRKNFLETVLMALTVSIALPGGAHYLGLCLKQEDKRGLNSILAGCGKTSVSHSIIM